MSVSINVGGGGNVTRPKTTAELAVEFLLSVPYDNQERISQLGTTPNGSSFEMKVRKWTKKWGYEANLYDVNPEYGIDAHISFSFHVAGNVQPTYFDQKVMKGRGFFASSHAESLGKQLDEWLAGRLPEYIAQAMA
jgi:hypothetical protein